MSKRSQCTEARFLKDAARHEMTIIHDDGVNRHVQFKRPDSNAYSFDLITWPGHLCYTGDMGTYVFTRIEDMFEFFRMDDHDWNKNPNGLSINPGYWSEKILATDKGDGHEEWDEDEFVRRVNEVRVGWMRWAKSLGISKDDRRELWEAAEDVLRDSRSERMCVARVYDFYYRIDGVNDFTFDDFFDCSLTRFSFRYLWACYAIVWGINKYDDHRNPKPE